MLCIHVEFGWRTMRERADDRTRALSHDCKRAKQRKTKQNRKNIYRCENVLGRQQRTPSMSKCSDMNEKDEKEMNEKRRAEIFASCIHWNSWQRSHLLFLHLIIIQNLIMPNLQISECTYIQTGFNCLLTQPLLFLNGLILSKFNEHFS